MYRKTIPFVLVLVALVFSSILPAQAAGRPEPAPFLAGDPATAIPGQFIVVFRDGVRPEAVDALVAQAADQEFAFLYRYTEAVNGFAARLSPRAMGIIRSHPDVAYVEADGIASIDTTQSPVTWGLDRIDQRNLPRSNSYTYTATGAGVTAYIIDTGIRASHNEFGGRASIGTDTVGDGQNGVDCNGHGTHVAGTVGGSTYGVAKGVSLVAVRVLNCSGSGTWSGVVAGIDWVTANHQAGKPAVANMSLGGGVSSTVDAAVSRSISDGVTYAIAAGNSNRDACKFSPARVPAAITVGATTDTDARASYSNYGSCLDLFAPGSNITSAWYLSNTSTNTISGTSMATPHVAGVAALYLQLNPGASPAAVSGALTANATAGVVSSPGRNSPNLLLFTNY